MKDYKQPNTDQSKRKLLLGLGAVIGSAAANQLLGGNAISVANAYTPRTDNTGAGRLLSAKQMQTLKAVCQTIIPATKTLGAGDVDVQGFVDNQLWHCFDRKAHKRVKKALKSINRSNKTRFTELTTEQQHTTLVNFDTAKGGVSDKQSERFKFLKWLIVFGYYTSEEGASKELTYLPLPGDFKGSVPYDSVGRNFGSYAFY